MFQYYIVYLLIIIASIALLFTIWNRFTNPEEDVTDSNTGSNVDSGIEEVSISTVSEFDVVADKSLVQDNQEDNQDKNKFENN